MALPEDWDGVDWRQGVIVLPNRTEGIPTLPLNRDRFPDYHRGYFMMATTGAWARDRVHVGPVNDHDPVVVYNAADVGEAGRLVSLFVFWHEMGHFHFGHQNTTIHNDPRPVASFSGHREIDADWFSFMHWSKRGTFGRDVIVATRNYLENLGGDGGPEHPPAGVRANNLLSYLNKHPWYVTIYNDDQTPGDFVVGLLRREFGMDEQRARQCTSTIERRGQCDLGPTDYLAGDARLNRILGLAREAGHPLRAELTQRTQTAVMGPEYWAALEQFQQRQQLRQPWQPPPGVRFGTNGS